MIVNEIQSRTLSSLLNLQKTGQFVVEPTAFSEMVAEYAERAQIEGAVLWAIDQTILHMNDSGRGG